MIKSKKCSIEICNFPAFSKGFCKKHCSFKDLKSQSNKIKVSKKQAEKRKEQRKDYPEFFKKHIDIIKQNNICCEECGEKLQGHVSEVAHILPKSSFPSISTNDLNVIYLCGMFSENQCHTNFDNFSAEKVKEMNIFKKISCIFAEIEPLIEEKINYKTREKYTWHH